MQFLAVAAALLGAAIANPIVAEPAVVAREANGEVSKRAVQTAEIVRCDWPSLGQYNSALDPTMTTCGTADQNVHVNWYGGQNWEVKLYGTKCRAFVDRDRGSAKVGEAFAHVDCPGVKNIKITRRDGYYQKNAPDWNINTCFSKNVQYPGWVIVSCWSEGHLQWDGCLSCGNPV